MQSEKHRKEAFDEEAAALRATVATALQRLAKHALDAVKDAGERYNAVHRHDESDRDPIAVAWLEHYFFEAFEARFSRPNSLKKEV